VSTWIIADTQPGRGPRVAVKDLIDMAGLPTTAGSRAVAATAGPASRDAACLAGLRAAIGAGRARFAGKTNLHELAYGISGVNAAYGTPVNPLDSRLVPGGSSSGSAVAVAAGEADIAYGTDTGGSIRIPAACCGIAGLKTTWGRVSLDGVRPLAPGLDTVGPTPTRSSTRPSTPPCGRPASPCGRSRFRAWTRSSPRPTSCSTRRPGRLIAPWPPPAPS
jgi:amidase